MPKVFSNWSGGVRFTPTAILFPRSEAEIQELVNKARSEGRCVRLVGAGHSFTPLIETSDYLVSLDAWQGIEQIEVDQQVVWVKAGTRLFRLNEALLAHGLAMVNLGDVNRQSIAGAASTGTHGTGQQLGSVATQIVALRLVSADGQLHTLTPEHPWFDAARVSLGALGIVTAVALQVRPAYKLRLELRKARLEQVLAELPQLLEQHRHLEFFAFPGSPYVQLKISDISDAPSSSRFKQSLNDLLLENLAFWGLSEISRRVPGSTSLVAKICGLAVSDQVQVDQSAYIFGNHRMTRFEEMEYNLPAEHFEERLQALLELIGRERFRVHFPIECRFVQADQIWLSPAYERASAYIAVHQYTGMPWQDYFQAAEQLFLEVAGRPHWGKRHFLRAADFDLLYPRWRDFQTLRQQLDPQGLFLNPHLQQVFGTEAIA